MAESSSLPFFSGLQKRKQSEYCRVPGSFPKKREKKRWNKWCPDEPRAKRQRIPDHRHPGEKEKRRSEAAELRERRFGHFLSSGINRPRAQEVMAPAVFMSVAVRKSAAVRPGKAAS